MNTTIKKRIEEINSGRVPEGYEKTSFGIFPCDWEKSCLGDLFNFSGGLGKSREELGDKGACYLHYGDMHVGDFNKVSYSQYLGKPKYDTKITGNETFLMKDGDIAFLDASEDLEGTSRAVLIDNPQNEPFIAGLHTILAKEKVVKLSKFYKQYITIPNSVKKQFQKLASGFKVYGINRDTIKKIEIVYPKSSQEQSRIAEILMQWDKAIELQEKLIKSYQNLKKYYLSKMFPKKGSLYPEIRFAGFTEPWGYFRLGEVGKARSGVGFPDSEQGGSTGIPFFKVSDMNLDGNESEMTLANNYVTSAQIASHRWSPVKDLPAIFFAKVGAAVLLNRKRLCRFPFLLDNNTMAYSLNFNWDADFAKALFETIDLTSLIQVGALPSYSAKDVEAIEICLPIKFEQVQIGVFFKNIDNLIAFYQSGLTKLIKQRKALQQYLLTGIVRV